MKTLYFDCINGVCADMILTGLRDLGVDESGFDVRDELEELYKREEAEHLAQHHNHDHEHHHHDHDGHHHHHHDREMLHGHHGLGFTDIMNIFQDLHCNYLVKHKAHNIYKAIGEAEARAHGTYLEDVHFHEVGRLEAIQNILTISYMLCEIDPDRIVVSEIHDGDGEIMCSHGLLQVPVPAVKEMMKKSGLKFVTDEGYDELVTPSGLGIIIGLGAEYGDKPAGSVIAKGSGYGGRDTGKGNMEIYLIEE